MSGIAKVLGLEAVKNKAGELALSSLAGKTVFLYFSASWCPPCRGFTPQLGAFYDKFAKDKNFEVVFVSWDEEEDDFNGYYEKMQWATLPFDEAKSKELTQTFNVESIPTLIGIDADSGEIVTRSARTMVVKDPEGEKFPWKE
ncbi:tryparedoxin, putative [Bodo saltans]|uniref:Tryparedoxin n=1 Tax=Bodo saltans TaxID=75058 RepID=B6DTG4_BODSA|nr:tryparedoxin [Bodo saltans]CUG90309.1 tryparedoxin, putative [Bodo saltans]|eukprot:CUG90309.1 tryparedoxin, putative [Bodo saltans]